MSRLPTTPTLRDLIEMGSRYAAAVFAVKGEYTPGIYHAVTADEQCLLIPDPPVHDHHLALDIMRDLFIQKDVVAYVYASETWTMELDNRADFDAAMADVDNLPNHPDSYEAVILVAESEIEGAMIGERKIIRPGYDAPYLAPLEIKAFVLGANATLLAHKTTLQ